MVSRVEYDIYIYRYIFIFSTYSTETWVLKKWLHHSNLFVPKKWYSPDIVVQCIRSIIDCHVIPSPNIKHSHLWSPISVNHGKPLLYNRNDFSGGCLILFDDRVR